MILSGIEREIFAAAFALQVRDASKISQETGAKLTPEVAHICGELANNTVEVYRIYARRRDARLLAEQLERQKDGTA